MKPQTFEGAIQKIEKLTPNVMLFSVAIEGGTGVEFEAGQYMILKIPSPTPLFRSYSIFSAPSEKNELQFLVELVPGGRASGYFEKFTVGEKLEMRGPFGFFTLQDAPAGHTFIATGTGIAPLRSMIKHLFVNNPDASAEVFFGVRSEEDVYLKNELDALAAAHPNFRCVLTLSRPSDGWTGERGRVTEHLEKFSLKKKKKYYLCGSTDMINAVTSLLHSKGVPRENILFERFY